MSEKRPKTDGGAFSDRLLASVCIVSLVLSVGCPSTHTATVRDAGHSPSALDAGTRAADSGAADSGAADAARSAAGNLCPQLQPALGFGCRARAYAVMVDCKLAVPSGSDAGGALINLQAVSQGTAPLCINYLADRACDASADGWEFARHSDGSSDLSQVVLCGRACDTARNTPGIKIEVLVDCH